MTNAYRSTEEYLQILENNNKRNFHVPLRMLEEAQLPLLFVSFSLILS